MGILDKVLRMGEGRMVRKLEKFADEVIALQSEYEQLTDAELQGKTAEFRELLANGATLDDIRVDAFATVREAAWRVLKQRPFKVQIMGGACLDNGDIAEMKTGEGKTLVATMPAYLNALEGKGAHVVTVNDYLASYQSELMGRVYRYLGMEVGCIVNGQSTDVRREQYRCDITYGTNNEFGFDYLRDNMASRLEDCVQRGHNYVIIDEVDSILIDEARTPLIISGPATGDVNEEYRRFASLVKELERDVDYEVDEKKHTIAITETGIEAVEDMLAIDNLYEASRTPLIGFLNNAIKAKELFERDRDYIVRGGEVIIVDEHTGRTMEGRRYNEGMHQAIEAKEGVEIKAENQTLATITLQNYFRLYKKLSGMTGTAETEAAEFASTYKIGVVPIPTNRPMVRKDQQDVVYATREGKLRAIVEDIAERHAKGQPILVGTTDVAKSEELSKMLQAKRIKHQVLNAKHHESEAEVVFQAGRKGAVTVATNMAGRGTDIMLGGNSEHIAEQNLRARGLDPTDNAEEYNAAWPEALREAEEAVAAEHEEVKNLGGLYVLGTERHDSRRIDNQLRGRSGRQGDPGESRFYLSMEDPLMQKFASGMAQRIMTSGAYPEDQPIEFKIVTRAIASAQSQVEGLHFENRKNTLKYDDIMNDQRSVIYRQRRAVLEKDLNMDELMHEYIDRFVNELVATLATQGQPEDWKLETVQAELKGIYPARINFEELAEKHGGIKALDLNDIDEAVRNDMFRAYDRAVAQLAANELAVQQLGEEPAEELQRNLLLEQVDRLWRDHLYEMDYLKEGIGLRAWGQRDPLVEYASEGAHMFQAMMAQVRDSVITSFFAYCHMFEQALEVHRAEIAAKQAAAQGTEAANQNGDAQATVSQWMTRSEAPSQAQLSYTDAETVAAQQERAASVESASGANRAERRAAKKAKRKKH